MRRALLSLALACATTAPRLARACPALTVEVDNDIAGSGYSEEKPENWVSHNVDACHGTYRYLTKYDGDMTSRGKAFWQPKITQSGYYKVSTGFRATTNRTDDADYRLEGDDGAITKKPVSQRFDGACSYADIGTVFCKAGGSCRLVLDGDDGKSDCADITSFTLVQCADEPTQPPASPCDGIKANGSFELCAEGPTSCAGVYTNGEGCLAFCAAAGMTCKARFGGEPGCSKEAMTPIPCDEPNDHLSDYCECEGDPAPPQGGSGGAPPAQGGAAGEPAVGGAGGESDGGAAQGEGGQAQAAGGGGGQGGLAQGSAAAAGATASAGAPSGGAAGKFSAPFEGEGQDTMTSKGGSGQAGAPMGGGMAATEGGAGKGKVAGGNVEAAGAEEADGGCGCRVGARRERGGVAALSLLGAVAARRQKRRAWLAGALLATGLVACGAASSDDSVIDTSPTTTRKTGQAGAGSGQGGSSSGNAGGVGAAGGSTSINVGNGGAGPFGMGGAAGVAQATGGAGGAVKTCAPACTAPQTCSQAGRCVDPGVCDGDGDCGAGEVCDLAAHSCMPGSACGVTKLVADEVPPNLLIVLDRSCSMTAKVGNKPKWLIAVQALGTLMTTYKDKIRFGLALFPDAMGEACQQDGPAIVPVAPGNEATITALLQASLNPDDTYFPDGPCVTNIDTAMQQAAGEPAFNDKSRRSFVLLLTDGKQSNSCGGDAADPITKQAIDGLLARDVGTFVIGFDTAIDGTALDVFAKAGGHPNPDPATDFYKAENEISLNDALASIAKETLGCDLALKSPPPDPDDIYVFFNGDQQVKRDKSHQGGWDYDAATQTVSFHGAECQALKQGTVTALDIVFGCPGGTDGSGGRMGGSGGWGGGGSGGGKGGSGGSGGPGACESGLLCDATHLCPNDPDIGSGFCTDGCCVFSP